MANITVDTCTTHPPSSRFKNGWWNVRINAFIAEDPEEVFETALKRLKASLSAVEPETINAIIAWRQDDEARLEELKSSSEQQPLA